MRCKGVTLSGKRCKFRASFMGFCIAHYKKYAMPVFKRKKRFF